MKIHNKEQLRYRTFSYPKRCWASMILGRISEPCVCGGKMLSKIKPKAAATFATKPSKNNKLSEQKKEGKVSKGTSKSKAL